MASTLKAQRGKAGGGLGVEETLVAETLRRHPRPGSATPGMLTVAAPLTSGSHPNSNAPGRRKEDDINLVAGPLGGGNDGVGRRSEDDPNLVPYALRKDPGGTGQAHNTNYVTHSLTSAGADASEDSTGRGTPLAAEEATVRRLTPTECERLQALPDGWTNPNGDAPDSRRYAALGDAVTASVGEWLGRRILAAQESAA